ncbi:MAG: monosaccharide transporter substrate-binding protein family [Herbinix sp.]|jgi:methyl-galactoside transport system substrate-binding protein|nr:monosaccharide transporter substrate-binding protein family [Herbinix sp.]
MTSKRIILPVVITFIIICILIVNYISSLQGRDNTKENERTSMKVGISIYNQYDTFISSLVDNLKEETKRMEQEKGITITLDIVNAGGSQVSQNYQVEEFINKGYDILCINLVDRTDASTAIDMAMSADIPVIFFNRELVEKDLERWDQLFYVGAVALESGIMQGQIVAEACEKNFNQIDKNGDGVLQYVILEGEAGHQDSSIRTEYVIKTITEAGISVEKLGDEIANWNRAQGETRMSQWLKTYDDEIEIIIANNDDMALGAIDAMKKENIAYKPVVVGIDGTEVGLEAVKNGDMIGTVLNDGMGQAEGIIELAYSVVFHKELPETIELSDDKYIRKPHIKVTLENIDKILEKK